MLDKYLVEATTISRYLNCITYIGKAISLNLRIKVALPFPEFRVIVISSDTYAPVLFCIHEKYVSILLLTLLYLGMSFIL